MDAVVFSNGGAACSERAFFELARRLRPGGRIIAPVKRGPIVGIGMGRALGRVASGVGKWSAAVLNVMSFWTMAQKC